MNTLPLPQFVPPFLPRARARCQHGAATVLVMLALFGALVLAVLFVNRGLLLELRMAANQARSTQAFEAAEAGVEWALAQLNDPARVGTDCRADAGAADSFRERHLVMAHAPGGFAARLGSDATPLRPACRRDATGWTCRCPADGAATLPASADSAAAAAFAVEFQPGGQPGVVKVVSTGCVDPVGSCTAGANATARIEARLVLRPALATPPLAPLTARGDVATDAPVELSNADPAANGLMLHAGGTVAAPALRLDAAAGASRAGSIAGRDATLAGLDDARLFATHFGVGRPDWRDQPSVRPLDCDGECGAAAAGRIGSGVTMLWIEGDAAFDGPLTLGSEARPVVLVVTGRLQLRGPVTVHGLVHAGDVVWNGSGAGAVHGALISTGGYTGDAAPRLTRDARTLARLAHGTGSFVKLPGSWRDF
jgi:hypothetical protein